MTIETAQRNLIEQAWKVGVPSDQLVNFHKGLYAPLPWTLEFHAAARKADRSDGPDEIGIGGSRGPGKSHAIFAQMALDDCRRRDGLKCLYLRKVGKQVREQLEDLRRKVLSTSRHKFNRQEGLIVFPNDSRILTGHFKTEADVDQYLGIEYDVIAIEEATTLTKVKHQALRDSNRTSRSDWRPRIYNSTNPGGVGHLWYKQRFVAPYRQGEQKFTRFFPATIDDNPLVDPGYKRKLEENTGWRLRAYRYGDWDIAAGAFFATFRYDVHAVEPFEVPLDWTVWLSMDYGFQHPTVVYLHAVDGDGIVTTVDEFAARRQQISQNAAGILAMLERNRVKPERLAVFTAGTDVFAKRDSGPTIAEKYAAEGLELEPANMDRIQGWAEMLARLGDVEQGIQPTWFISKRCRLLLQTLPILEHDPNRPEDVLKADIDEDGYGGDDAADAARYGLMEAELGAQKTYVW